MRKFLALSRSDDVFIMLINVKMPIITVDIYKQDNVVFIMLINVKMPTVVDILTFMSKIIFVLS